MKKLVLKDNRQLLKDLLCLDDFAVDIIAGEANRLTKLSVLARYPFLFHGILALVTNIIFPLNGLKRKVVSHNDDDFIFVSCPDTAFRTKNIPILAGALSYLIIYLPNFHLFTALKYHRFFKEHNIKVFFPTIKIGQVISAKRKMSSLKKRIGKMSDMDDRKIMSVLSSYLIYDSVVKAYMGQVRYFQGKWILEHQKFYFLASVVNLRSKGIESTMLQHGIFFQPVYDFIPLLCDKVLCCSEREKKIYENNGTQDDRVIVLGAPLQTLQKIEITSGTGKQYDLLVLMTLINNSNVDLIRSVLTHIKQNYSSVLVRMRPRSRKNDENLLANVLKGMTVSKRGTPIVEDIIRCNKVVSFSVDANIEVSKFHKPFVYIWDEEDKEAVSKLNCATKDNYKVEIQKLMASDNYSTFTDDQYNEILGETDIKTLQEKFEVYIKK